MFSISAASAFAAFTIFSATAVLAAGDMSDLSRYDLSKYNSASCNRTSRNPTVAPAAKAGKLTAHISYVCFKGKQIGTVVFWSGTNREGNRLTTALSNIKGKPVPLVDSQYDAKSGANIYQFTTRSSRKIGVICELVKPAGGIAPRSLAICRK